VVPAYRPGRSLVDLVGALAEAQVPAIVVVDDGSGPEHQGVFEAVQALPRVHVLKHAVNLGKGAALKTGINHVLCALPEAAGIVTADADGQHHPSDIVRVARKLEANPQALVLGVRDFSSEVPLRSRLGNTMTRGIVRLVIGQRLSDTQTGLRGIPRALLPRLLRIVSSGYEFELDMLIAAKHQGCPVLQVSIRTIYEHGNPSSHFNPLLDSMRIYFVLFRFSILSLVTAALDNLVFYFIYRWTGSVLGAQAVARATAVLFNYSAARRAVFLSRERHRTVLPKYLLLVIASGTLSYALIGFFDAALAVPVIWAKPLAESLLFIANFAIQRDFVFTRRRRAGGATDWDRYYRSTPFTARLTRKYTTAVLVAALKKFAGVPGGSAIVEIGGANSCFLDRILAELRPRSYHVIDNNEYGLDLLRRRLAAARNVELHREDVLRLSLDLQADAVFSVGLIEHFGAEETEKAIATHFDLLKPGGCAILSFPTATPLYRAARFVCELFGLWKFPDERPLSRTEVLRSIGGRGRVVFEKTLWPLVFTQHLVVVEKASAAAGAQATASP
jgi:putative flippase GtrA